MSKTGTRVLAGLAAVLMGLSLAACAPKDAATEAYLNGTNQGYIPSELSVKEFAPAERGDAVDFTGVTEDGEKIAGSDLLGDVVVVNFWYAACGPCRVEAPDLESVWQDYQNQNVQFVGVNTNDQADTAIAFAQTYGITYPSIIDEGDGAAKLAFAKAIPIQATPTTLVLDKQGRVAARIIGQLDGPSILSTLVRDTLAEES